MKKWMTMAAAALILTLSLSACGTREQTPPQTSLYDRGLEVVQLMSQMAKSEEYVAFYGANEEVAAVIRGIAAGDYSAPRAVYAISLSPERLLSDLDLPEELNTYLIRKSPIAMMTGVNTMAGPEAVAAAAICSAGQTFSDPSLAQDVIYLYTYQNAPPAAVTFTMGQDHTVSSNGIFILYDGFSCGSPQEIRNFFGETVMAVEEVSPEG